MPLATDEQLQEQPAATMTAGTRGWIFSWPLLLFAASISTAIGRSFTAIIPERDGYLFAYMGSQWLHGRIPYLHIWDNKPPGIYAIDALVFSAFPNSFTALAVMEGVVILGCIVTVYFLVRQWGAPRAIAIFAAACACVACNLEELNGLGNFTEIYLLWPATLSMYWFTRAERLFPPGGMFLAGVFAGVASLFKPVGLAPALAQAAFLLFLVASRQLRLRIACRALVLGAAGIVFAWVPFCIYFWKHDALREMLNAALIYPLKYGAASQMHLLSEPLVIASRLLPMGSIVVCALAGLVWFVVFRSRPLETGERPEATECAPFRYYWPLVTLWVIFDLAGALGGGFNFGHYYLCTVPSLSVAAGVAAWFISEIGLVGASPVATRNLLFAFVIGPLLLSQSRDALRLRNFFHLDQGGEQQDMINAPIQGLTNELDDVAGYLNRVRHPGDTLFMWNYLPLLYFKTGMRAPTRPISAEPLKFFQQSHDQFGQEILQDLETSPPTFIVDATADPAKAAATDRFYREFHYLVQRSYQVVYTTHDREREFVLSGELRVYRKIQ